VVQYEDNHFLGCGDFLFPHSFSVWGKRVPVCRLRKLDSLAFALRRGKIWREMLDATEANETDRIPRRSKTLIAPAAATIR